MDPFIRIYNNHAAAYHRMIAAEDADKQILPALKSVRDLQNARILDLGTGTGRLPILLRGQSTTLTGVDIHWAMLEENLRQKFLVNGNWSLAQGDLRRLPFSSCSFEMITIGWAMGHFCGWYPETWQTEIDNALQSMKRLLVPNGVIIILETLTTGSRTPKPPTKALARYYAHLENKHNFQRQEIQTDFQFDSVEEAIELTEFFFGHELSVAIRNNNWSRLPEWTGVWSKAFP